jgi:hypothetical protein
MLGRVKQHLFKQLASGAAINVAHCQRLARVAQRADQTVTQQLKLAETLNPWAAGGQCGKVKSVREGFAAGRAKQPIELSDLRSQRSSRRALVGRQREAR